MAQAWGHTHQLRKGRYSEAGRGYLLTTVTHQRSPLFTNFDCARQTIAALHACDALELSHTLAFVVMPDHVHWLVQLRLGTLGALMQRFKSCSGKAINQLRRDKGQPVWQAGFHDYAVRDGQDIRHLARYVIANPVRAGLVTRVGDYPHWYAVWV